MALANSTWDFSPGQPAWSATRRRQASLNNTLVISGLLACSAVAASMAFHVVDFSRLLHRDRFLPAATHAAPAAAARSALSIGAETFLRDSLKLTADCRSGCPGVVSEVAQAQRLGHFGLAAGLAVPTGLPLQQGFAAHDAPAPAPLAKDDFTGPAFASAKASLARALIHIETPVVVPLPEAAATAAPSGDAPVPAPRFDRSSENPAGLATLKQPLEDASVPLGTPAPVASPPVGRGDGVAVYDISAAVVYMPDGTRLEAHSGLGYMADNPHYVNRKNIGPTPPGTYRLDRLGSLFYGVEALRMVPIDSKTRYGRDGFLTHTYLLRGRPKQSNGCVVFPNYARFLDAYKHGKVNRLVVVASLKDASTQVASR